ncbi:hypothetical protein ABVN80_19190 [Acinetobacter baumannii]
MPITQRYYEAALQAGSAEGFRVNCIQGGDTLVNKKQIDDGVVGAEFTEVKG